MSQRSTTCSSSPLECIDVFHTRGQTCQRILKWHFDSLYSGPSTLFLCFYLCCLCRDEMNVHICLWTCLHIWIENTTQKSLLSPWYSHCKLFWAFHVFPMQLKLNLAQVYCSFKSAVRKCEIAHNIQDNQHPLRSNTEGCGCKTHYTDSKGSSATI
jgi:hypothetical protein